MNRSNLFIFNSELKDIRRLIFRLCLLCLPFFVAAVFIFAVDPFNFLSTSGTIPEEIKRPVALQFNPPFWKLNKFERDPMQFVLLGDSRMASLETGIINEISGDEYTNLAYGGASMREIIDTFWVVAKKVRLRRVYVGVSLEKYNDYEITDRLTFYKSAVENPALYFVNRAVWEAAYYDLEGYLTGVKFTVGTPSTNREEFWLEELQLTAAYYRKYAEPKKYRKELLEMSNYCLNNGIELRFIIFPTHIDAQNVILESGFQAKNETFRQDLMKCGDVYDFDWPTDLTRNRSNFDDPMHIKQGMRQMVIAEVWTNELKYGRLFPYAH